MIFQEIFSQEEEDKTVQIFKCNEYATLADLS